MGATRAFAVSSGMTALDLISRLVSAGQEIIAGNDLYGGTNRLLSFMERRQGIKVHHVDTINVENILAVLNKNTKLILLETPTNPLIKIVDLINICKLSHQKEKDVLIVVDNTMVTLNHIEI